MSISVERLGAWGWRVILVSAFLYLAGAGFSAVTWQPQDQVQSGPPETGQGACPDPPCFDPGGLPRARDLPVVLPLLGFLAAILLGVAGFINWLLSQARRRPEQGQGAWLFFFGPLLVFVGTELLPHLLSPCTVALLGESVEPPAICTRTQNGIDVRDQWHALSHSLTGALPMTGLYWLSLRKWRPEALRARAPD